MPENLISKMRFDQRLREAFVELLASAHTMNLVQTLSAQERQAIMDHARLLGWQAPIALISTHEAAEMAISGDVQAFESMVTLAQICYQHATTPDFLPLHDALQSSVLHHAVMGAVEAMASIMPHRNKPLPTHETGRIAFVLSSLISGAGTTYVMQALIPALVAKGWQVAVYYTMLLDATDLDVAQELQGLGVSIYRPSSQPQQLAIACWITEHLNENPVDVLIHYVWPNDFVSKLVSNVECASVQVFINHTCDQPTGKFDLKIGYSGDYKGHHQPDKYVTFPNCSVRAGQARRAEPFDRAQWGVSSNMLLLATFSRLAKCVDKPFLEAICSVLRSNPNVAWLLVGERDASSEVQINAYLNREGVQNQVAYVGFMHGEDYFRLLKTVDIYCDTITWMGGQTVADAVVCGLPIVCCAPSASAALAPYANNSTVLASSLLAPGSLIGQPGGGDYAQIVQAYIDDPVLRAKAGALNAESVTDDAWHAYVEKFDAEIRRVLRFKLNDSRSLQEMVQG